MDYYSFTDPTGMQGWVGLVGWPMADSLSAEWSPVVNHRLGAGQESLQATEQWATPPTYTVMKKASNSLTMPHPTQSGPLRNRPVGRL